MKLNVYRGYLVNTIILSVDLMTRALESKDKDTVKTTEGSLDDNMKDYLRSNGITINLEQKYVDLIHELALRYASFIVNNKCHALGLFQYANAVNEFEKITGIRLTYTHTNIDRVHL